MFKLLVDTCVWLDLAKDSQQEPLLSALEELIRRNQITLVLPRTVIDEFARNKGRVTEESCRSLSSVFKRVKDTVSKFGTARGKHIVLDELDELDYKIPVLGEAAIESIRRIEKLFNDATIIEITDDMKLRAAQRAIDGKAPFHRQRNGISDAILIEVYSSCFTNIATPGVRFGFVTHNTKDFSHPTADNRFPHPDIAMFFSRTKSLYFISLVKALQRIQPELVSDLMLEHQEGGHNPRRLSEILDAMGELLDKIWYNRHQNLLYKIKSGKIKIIESNKWTMRNNARVVTKETWVNARKAAQRIEKEYGVKNLGPWTDFEWGMLSGKLSALRWTLGDEWDMLDT